MKIEELVVGQQIVVQIVWGEREIEFPSEVVDRDINGIFVKTYTYQDKPLELNIDMTSGVICNVFTNNPDGKRVSWKNVDLTTKEFERGMVYYLNTRGFNNMAQSDDRRTRERISIRKNGRVYDKHKDCYTDVLIHDISDAGISIYAPQSFNPSANQFQVMFEDRIDNREYKINVECAIVRSQQKVGTVFYGCKLVGENKDYLIYGFMKRLMKKNAHKG